MQKEKTTIGYVYLVHAIGTKRYKIGLTTREPYERLKELNGKQSAYELELMSAVECYYPRALERVLHQKYKPFRKWGEWFELTDWKVSDVQRDMTVYKTEIEKTKHQKPGITLPRFNMALIIGVLAVLALITHCAAEFETQLFNKQNDEEQVKP